MASDQWDGDDDTMTDDEVEALFADDEAGVEVKDDGEGDEELGQSVEAGSEAAATVKAEVEEAPVVSDDEAISDLEAEIERELRAEQEAQAVELETGHDPIGVAAAWPPSGSPAQPSPQPEQHAAAVGVVADQQARSFVDMDTRIRSLESENRRIMEAIEKMPAFLLQALQTGQIGQYAQPQSQPEAQQQPEAQDWQPSIDNPSSYTGGPVEITPEVSGRMVSSQEMHLPQQQQLQPQQSALLQAAQAAGLTPAQVQGMMAAGSMGSGMSLDGLTRFFEIAIKFAEILGIGKRRQAQAGPMNTQGLQEFMNVMQQFMSLNAGFKNMQAMEMEATTKHLGRMFRMMGTNLVGMMQTMGQEEGAGGDGGGDEPSFDAFELPPQGGKGGNKQEGGK